MGNTSLVKIKILFSLIVVLIVVMLSAGSFLLTQNIFLTSSYVSMLIKYPWYELAIGRNDGGGFFASLFPVSQSKDTSIDDREAMSIPALLYHGVGDGAVRVGTFKDHMKSLKDAGWETVSIEEFQKFMKGEIGFPEKSFLLTFDDGRKDSYYPVDPILRALDYEAVMFVITNQIFEERERTSHFYLSKKELQHMEKTGRWDIQSHGKLAHEFYPIEENGEQGHFYSNLLWTAEEQRFETPAEFQIRVYKDLAVSKEELEQIFQKHISALAFPFGDFGQNVQDSKFPLAKDILLLGAKERYAALFYQWWQGEGFTHNYANPETYMIKRLEPKSLWSGEDLVAVLEQGKVKQLPYQDDFSQNKGWLSTWGSFSIMPEKGLMLKANEEEAGASVILDGSGAWKDYEVIAHVDSPMQTGVFMWVRFQDGNNNAACNFGKDFAHIEQVLNGKKNVIQGVRGVSAIPSGDFTVGARMQGRTLECFMNGEVLTKTEFLDNSLDRGGIGFKMWDEEIGKATLGIKQVSAVPL